MSFIHGLKWSFFSELASKAIQPVVVIVLARLLTPEDYGVMTSAMMVIAFSQIFWDAGMGKALIQRQTDIEEASNAVFLINIALGIIIAALLYLFAKPIAQTFFHDDRVIAVLQVMTLQVLFGALSSVQNALLQKEMGFKKLFWVRFATVSLPGLASIPLAMNGFGYWALVAGTLVGQLAQVIMLWTLSQWRPTLVVKYEVAKEIGKFGVWVGLSGLLAWFYMWADSFVVGAYMGSHDLGLYRTGNQIVTYSYSLLSAPLMPVLYSWMVSRKIEEIRAALMNVVSFLSLIFMPIAIFIFMQADFVSNFVFGKNWLGISLVIAVMALSHGLSSVLVANSEAYRASGVPQYETYPMLIGLLIFVPVYIYSAQRGLEYFLYSRLFVVVGFGYILHSFLARKKLRVPNLFYIKYLVLFVLFITLSVLVKNSANKDYYWLTSILLPCLLFAILAFFNRREFKAMYEKYYNKNGISI